MTRARSARLAILILAPATARMSMARLVRQPEQYASSHGPRATMAHWIFGDRSGDRSAFHRPTTWTAAYERLPPLHKFGDGRGLIGAVLACPPVSAGDL